MKEPYFKVTNKKSVPFIAVLLIVLAMQLSMMALAIYHLAFNPERAQQNIPLWYLIATIVLLAFGLVGTLLTYQFKKIGVYAIAASFFVITSIQPSFTIAGSLASVFALFFFVVFGLAVIIPRWRFFT